MRSNQTPFGGAGGAGSNINGFSNQIIAGRSSNLRQPTTVKPKQAQAIVNQAKTAANQVFQIANQLQGQKLPNIASQSAGGVSGQRPFSTHLNNGSPSLAHNNISNTPYQPISLFIHKILGSTSNSPKNLLLLTDSICLYTAQSFLVFYDFRLNKQLCHYQNPNNSKAYRAIAYDEASKRIFAGEGNTKQGEIHVLRVNIVDGDDIKLEQQIVLKGHKYGIDSLKIRGDLLVSIGDDNDKGMITWDLKTPRMLTANLMKESLVKGLEFVGFQNDTQVEFITFGTNGHLKIWHIPIEKDDYMTIFNIEKVSKIKQGQPIPMLSGMKLKIMKETNLEGMEWSQIIIENMKVLFLLGFTMSGEHKQYTIVRYCMQENVTKQIKLPTQSGSQQMINVNQNHLLITGSFKRLQLIEKASLKFSTEDFTWAQPPQKGQLQMITQEIYDYLISTASQSDSVFSQITGVLLQYGILIQLMSDGMILFHDYGQQKLLRVMIQHFDTINDLVIKEYQATDEQLSFFTCSKDNTLRLWNTFLGDQEIACMMLDGQKPVEGDLKRTVYLDSQDKIGGSFANRVSLADDEAGIKCLAYNQMRNQLAIGDMVGNIRIYQMSPDNHQYLHQVNFIEAHEGKVVALQYSEPFNMNNSDQYVQFLVSASQDRMVHIFNARADDYELIQTLDAHTTSIVDAKFIKCTIGVKNKHKVTQYEKQLRLYTCSTDKTLQCHKYNPIDGRFITMQPKDLHRNKIYKLALTEQNLIMAKDQGIIEVKSLESGKQVQQFQQASQHQTLSKAMLDYTYAAVSADQQLLVLNDKEKSIQIRENRNCNSLLAKFGLADNLSSLQFSLDNKFLIGSSQTSKDQGGGLIYIFRVEHDVHQVRRENIYQNQQRNQDRVIVVDLSSLNHPLMKQQSDSDKFDQIFQNPPQQRKFTVKDELFNTWAKSTNQQQNSNEQTRQNESKQIIPKNTFNEDEEILNQAKSYQKMRKSTMQHSNVQQSKGAWIRPSTQALNQQTPENNDDRSGIEDFIDEMQNNNLDASAEQNSLLSDSLAVKKESEVSLQIQELEDDELQRRVQLNLAQEQLNANESLRNTLTMRTSLTLKYLIETPRNQTNNQQSTVPADAKTIQFTKKIQPDAIMEGQENSPQEEIKTSNKKKKKTLYTKLVSKIEKIDEIIMEQEEIDPNDLKIKERLDLSIKINKTLQKLQQLQLKFITMDSKNSVSEDDELSGFTLGTTIGTTFICGMDDVIYGQLRRNIIIPLKQVIQPQKPINLDELLQVGQGTMNFASQFKPHALGKTNVKALLMSDNDYATPQDHYFGYINKREQKSENIREQEVLSNLNLDTMLPSYYNIETGRFDLKPEQYLDKNGNLVKEEDMDIFEIARLRGVPLNELEELMSEKQIDDIRRQEKKQKHSKKDYEKLKTMNIANIVNLTEEKRKVQTFQDESLPDGMVKIEKKRQQSAAARKKRTQQQREKDLEIQRLLQNPQEIDYDKAIKIYEEQGLEAKDVSQRDKRRLRRLKKKAEGEVSQIQLANENQSNNQIDESNKQTQQKEDKSIENRRQEDMATSIKIEIPVQNSRGDEVDDIVK